MATVSAFTRGAVTGNSWTSAANATADDGSYTTCAPGKNSSVSGSWDFAAFTNSDIPVGSTINSVTAEVQYKVSTTASVATFHYQGKDGGSSGTDHTDTSEPTTDTNKTLTDYGATVSESDLKTAGQIVITLQGQRGNSNTAVTFSVDYIKLTVDYTPPPPTVTLSSPADSATGISVTPTLAFSGTASADITYETQVDTVNTFDSQGAPPSNIDSSSGSFSTNAGIFMTNATQIGVGTSFTGDGSTLGSASLKLNNNSGSPTGFIVYKVYAHTGTFGTSGKPTGAALATSGTLDVSTLTSTFTYKELFFTGGNQITLTNGTHYFLTAEISTVGTNIITVEIDTGGTGNYATENASSVWTAASGAMAPFIVKNAGSIAPLIDATSASGGHDAAQFTDTTNGADTDPFASGDSISFVVPSGETLTNSTTYYWRVRGKDPSGTNTWSSWATTRSFTTTSGSTDLSINKSDSVTVTEAVGRMVESYVNKSDSSAVTESIKREVNSFVNVSDSSTLTENVQRLLESYVNKSDASTITENVTPLLPFLLTSVSDTSTITENLLRTLESFVSTSDASTITENIVMALANNVNVNDSSTITENIQRMLESYVSTSDSSAITESITPFLTPLYVSVSDSSTVTENIQRRLESYVTTSDASTITENLLRMLNASVNVNDSSTVTESIGRMLQSFVTVSDSSGVTENVVVQIATVADLNVTVSDSSAITENLLFLETSFVNKSDSSAITENVVMLETSFVTVSDSPAVTDSVTVVVNNAVDRNVTVSDSSGVTDSVNLLIPFLLVSVSDTSAITDNSIVQLGGVTDLNINTSDASTITESVTPLIPFLLKSVSDTSAITENVNELLSVSVNVSDTSTITENTVVQIATVPNLSVNVNDSSAITETVAARETSFVTVSDSSTVTENTVEFLTPLYTAVSDTSGVTDSTQLTEVSFVNVNDSSSVTENLLRRLESNVNTSDSTTVTENIGRLLVAFVTTSDSTTITENVAELVTPLRISVSDSTTVTDSRLVSIAGAGPTKSKSIIFLTDGRIAVRLSNNFYMPL